MSTRPGKGSTVRFFFATLISDYTEVMSLASGLEIMKKALSSCVFNNMNTWAYHLL